MKIKQQDAKKGFILNTLAFSLLVMHVPAYALQAMDDSDLRNVNGQDGINIETSLTEANIDKLYWTDQTGRTETDATGPALTAIANQVKIEKNSAVSTTPLTAALSLNLGTVNAKPAVDLNLKVSPMLMSVQNFNICDTVNSARCSAAIGNLAVQTSSDTTLNLKTSNGLFSKSDQASLTLGLQNANIYLGQTSVSGQLNQLVLKNFNFNFDAKGYAFIDKVEGLKLQTNLAGNASTSAVPSAQYGYADLNRVDDAASSILQNNGTYAKNGKTSNAGLNLEIMLNKGVSTSSPYAVDTTNTPTGAVGLIRVGASGRMVNSFLQFRGVQNSGTLATNLIGSAVNSSGVDTGKDILSGSGLAFRMKTDFTQDNDSMLSGGASATTLEIGGAGLNSYGFEFGNLTGLVKTNRASFDTGSVFLNLTDTQQVKIPENKALTGLSFAAGDKLATLTDYTQTIYDTNNLTAGNRPYSLLTSIRGAEFQGLSRRGRFTTSANVAPADQFVQSNNGLDNKWGLALPFYNLNANLAMFGTTVDASKVYYYTANGTKTAVGSGQTPRLGLSLGLSTDGIDRDATNNNAKLGNKTTSILVIDAGQILDNNGNPVANTSKDYYMGLRNIDMLLKGYGSVGVENGSLNLSLSNMLAVMAAEVAAGYLPGSTYASCTVGITAASAACGAKSGVGSQSFASTEDVLFGLKMRIGGNMNLSLIPSSAIGPTGNRLTIVGDLDLATTKNSLQISEPVDGAAIGLDNLTGSLGFTNAIVIGKNATGTGQVGFNTSLRFNPTESTTGVFRARDLNFYPAPPTSGATVLPARLGEIAITGGRLSGEFNIIPRNN